ncbi:hypothetical protein ABMA28_015130 [Loxostege sticticalis]|uniref:Prostaglandin reductase 1 n=1 Tax=Loxostege sticticalis TaxID=481309 RepID=A0ABD0TEC1_LOXSC
MVKARKYVVKRQYKGVPKKDDFEIVEYELPPLKDNEILTKTEWISVDPFQRTNGHLIEVPFDQFGYQVGLVIQSKNLKYPRGTRIVSMAGWCDYTILNPNAPAEKHHKYYDTTFYKLPDLQGLSVSHGVGAVGMPGASAYFGFLEECKPQAGETVVVTGAAGAVGSIVGQIAKIKGCKVIGFAGSDEKVKWLETELGFDKAINYKTADVYKALKEAAPEGVDCYFDNVGGELSSAIISQMRLNGRVTVCGSISAYNEDALFDYSTLPKATVLTPFVLANQLRIKGFVCASRPLSRWPEAFEDITKWIKSGQLKAEETVTEGFDNLYDAFVGMLAGKNFGKAVVKV